MPLAIDAVAVMLLRHFSTRQSIPRDIYGFQGLSYPSFKVNLAGKLSLNSDPVSGRPSVALAKAKPGTLNFGSTGAGGLSHLVGELLKSSTGTQMTHIAYKGTGPALNDLLGGQM